jgi:hypothetical protein
MRHRCWLAVCHAFLFPAVYAIADNTIDISKGWRFQPDPDSSGSDRKFSSRDVDDAAWPMLNAGLPWEEQGFVEMEGTAWYRRWVDIPADWKDKPAWLVIAGVDDAATLYVNGAVVNSFGRRPAFSVHLLPIIVPLQSVLKPGERNLIALSVDDWGAGGGLTSSLCLLTTDPARVPGERYLSCLPEYVAKRLVVDVSLAGLGNNRPNAALHVELFEESGQIVIAKQSQIVEADSLLETVAFDLGETPDGKIYRVRATLETKPGETYAGTAFERRFEWPAKPGWGDVALDQGIKNNFVTTLLALAHKTGRIESAFTNPRNGWVFFRLSNPIQSDTAPLQIDGQADPIVWRKHPETGSLEAMLWLKKGVQTMRTALEADATLEVSSVPELGFYSYPARPAFKAYGKYDKSFYEKHVYPNINVLITDEPQEKSFVESWSKEGRHWISREGLPGLMRREAATPETTFDTWTEHDGFRNPEYDGIIVDEFVWGDYAHYRQWEEALRRLHNAPEFRDKKFYAWCVNLFRQYTGVPFIKTIIDLDHRFSWEKYVREDRTIEATAYQLRRDMHGPFEEWKTMFPPVERHTLLCLGYINAGRATFSTLPHVNYNVLLDMQMHMAANEPAFWNLLGVMAFTTGSADEETIRFTQQLYRHYGIEGNRERFTSDPLILTHIQNPDFNNGLEGWRAEAAERDSVAARHLPNFGWMQGRYFNTGDGDHFCWMKRSASKPNRLIQTAEDLTPGKLYSLKVWANDLGRLENDTPINLGITIENADVIAAKSFHEVFVGRNANELGDYGRSAPVYTTQHQMVFRAKEHSTRIAIGDWRSATESGGPIGQEIALNFVEFQPYFEN